MPKVWGFNEFDGRQLKKVAKERHLNSLEESLEDRLSVVRTTQRTYVVILSSPIAAAVSVGGGNYTISGGVGTVKTRSHAAGELYSADPANTITSLSLITASNLDGNITRRIFNATTSVVPANTPLLAVQDIAGDLWVVQGGTASTVGTPFYNNSGETAPPFAVMQFTGGTRVISGTTYYDICKPGGLSNNFAIQWLINGSEAVNNTATGTGTMNKEVLGPVIMGSNSIAVFNSQELGPMPGSWGLWPSRQGFMVVGTDYDNVDGLVHAVDCVQRPITHVIVRLYGQLTQNSNGNAFAEAEIWERNSNTGLRYAAGWAHIYTYGHMMNNGDIAKAGVFGNADLVSIGLNIWEGDFACDPDNTNSTQSPYGNPSGWEDFQFSGDGGSDSGSTFSAAIF